MRWSLPIVFSFVCLGHSIRAAMPSTWRHMVRDKGYIRDLWTILWFAIFAAAALIFKHEQSSARASSIHFFLPSFYAAWPLLSQPCLVSALSHPCLSLVSVLSQSFFTIFICILLLWAYLINRHAWNSGFIIISKQNILFKIARPST